MNRTTSRTSTRPTDRPILQHGLLATALIGAIALTGCKATETATAPDYAHQLAPGEPALRKITDPSRLPDIAAAYRDADPFLQSALDRSIAWFAAPSSKQWFPIYDITHEQARASVMAFNELLGKKTSPDAFVAEFLDLFDVYESVGYNGQGIVLFTGYFSPEFKASRTQTDSFRFPLYKRPPDLVTDPVTGEPRGRKLPDGTTVPYPSRREIEESRMLAGTELVWLDDPFAAYLIHVNGSAKLRLPDNSLAYVGYAGKTDRPYGSLRDAVAEAGMMKKEEINLAALKKLYQREPAKVMALFNHNESYVFFREYDGASWPSGSLGVRVTEERTLATDKKIYPRGGVVLADTTVQTFSRGPRSFKKFMLDQDTGGAIRAPGRADLYMGIGPAAEILAGGQYFEGRLYYLVLKPEHVESHAATPAAGAPARLGDAHPPDSIEVPR